MISDSNHYDLIVIGAGSGGIGAAVTGARLGLRTLLVEKADRIGGNAVRGGVHNWEPGCGGTGLPFELYRSMRQLPLAASVNSMHRHIVWARQGLTADFPGGETLPDAARSYYDTCHRHGTLGYRSPMSLLRERWHAVVFEPEAYCHVAEQMLRDAGCTLLKQTAFTRVHREGSRIVAVDLDNGMRVSGRFFVDGTADALLAIAAGVPTTRGQEPRHMYGEPRAPEQAMEHINGVTLIYRVTPTETRVVQPLPDDVPDACWWRTAFPVAAVSGYPNGDLNINMLPTLEGRELFTLGYRAAWVEGRRRVLAHWHHWQTQYEEFRRYRISWVAPALGVRETQRIVGRYVLTEHDLIDGISRQRHDDIIALADHAIDTHGQGGSHHLCNEMPEPYGVPLRSMLPSEYVNLAVACRGFSASSLVFHQP